MSEFECPRCSRGFGTRRGLGVHHSQVHDERLPNRECSNCGTHFYADYAKEYCSEECHDESVSFAGSDNPNYRGGKTATECARCDTEFLYYPSEKDGVYCSDCVEEGEWRNPPTPESGTDHPWWRGGKRELDCEVCGSTFERHPGNIQGDVVVCNEDCRAVWLSESFTGEGHPNWKGGGNQDYGPGWNEIREVALERDDRRCLVCGTTREELGRNPDVHHIVPVRTIAASDEHDVEDAHYLGNLVSLCSSCHRKAEFGTILRERLRALVARSR